MRLKFWQDSLDRTFSDHPPREPICILLHQALRQLELRAGGDASRQSIKFWVSRLVRTRQRYMDNRPFPNLAALEDYAENTYSTLMYATLAFLPLRSTQLDHLASHMGKANGIVATLRGIPYLSSPPQPIQTPKGASAPSPRTPVLLLPLDIMSTAGVKEEAVFRKGPSAPGLQDAVFKVATRAHDHLLTAREMLARLTRGEDAGHEYEHGGEEDHVYGGGDDDVRMELRRCFGVFLEAVPAGVYLDALEKVNFDPWAVRPGKVEEVKTIVKTVGTAILENGGVIRGLCNWGVYALPRPISIHQMQHAYGHHFVLRYDSSTGVHRKVRQILRAEPRMLRAVHAKLGDNTLPVLARFGAPAWIPQSVTEL
ncbi:hypothetical protein CDD80_6336 [Ophiocordyceps camponoti-rufipedis]|uniref:Phytoene synthase n=1 Tax=Ophiocordyceps camponoti-rufipedis TaxID=2004952 RepID=A0A2C5YQS1_9HYPO|nr:hypothetical protein CDD80_6336 [Ophiocordyceps camponoti-rufipedis]